MTRSARLAEFEREEALAARMDEIERRYPTPCHTGPAARVCGHDADLNAEENRWTPSRR